jgi:hypothetical protein
MALHLREYVERRGKLRANFTLPGEKHAIEVEGEITWADDHGRLGVHFISMPDSSRAVLERWLAERGRTVALDAHAEIRSRKKRGHNGGRAAAQSAAAAAPAPEPQPTIVDQVQHAVPYAGPRARQTVRAGVEVGIKIVLTRGGEPATIEAVCEDISPEGIGAKVHGDLCPGEPVLLHLNLPSLESMKVHADVRNRHKNRVGLIFVGLSREQYKQLADMCELLPLAE